MAWQTIGYAALCVLAPVAWGLAVYWASARLERRLLPPRSAGENPETLPLEYHI